MNIAVIPARGGSKRVPRKNVRAFCGRPMIAWSIDVALASGCFDRVIVSTDDDEIAEVALACGAEVPFRRPTALADDFTPTVPVVAHAVQWQQASAPVARACCIYATAPFTQPQDLRAGLSLLDDQAADYVFPVATYDFPIQRAIRLDAGHRVSMFQPEHLTSRSQDLEEAYHDVGQFYWGTSEAWLSHRPIFGDRSVALRVPRSRSQDIDTVEDWEHAERMFGTLLAQSHRGDA